MKTLIKAYQERYLVKIDPPLPFPKGKARGQEALEKTDVVLFV